MSPRVISTLAIVAAMSWPLATVAQDAPAQPAPAQPAPTEPAPAQPAPTEPAPAQQAPAEPAPAQPADSGADVDLTVEQQTEIKTQITSLNIAPVTVDFDVSIGVAVPATVTLQPLPAQIIALYPQWEGYLFFVLADGRIVIVAPDTKKVIIIIA